MCGILKEEDGSILWNYRQDNPFPSGLKNFGNKHFAMKNPMSTPMMSAIQSLHSPERGGKKFSCSISIKPPNRMG